MELRYSYTGHENWLVVCRSPHIFGPHLVHDQVTTPTPTHSPRGSRPLLLFPVAHEATSLQLSQLGNGLKEQSPRRPGLTPAVGHGVTHSAGTAMGACNAPVLLYEPASARWNLERALLAPKPHDVCVCSRFTRLHETPAASNIISIEK
jgi:hypothetical protein